MKTYRIRLIEIHVRKGEPFMSREEYAVREAAHEMFSGRRVNIEGSAPRVDVGIQTTCIPKNSIDPRKPLAQKNDRSVRVWYFPEDEAVAVQSASDSFRDMMRNMAEEHLRIGENAHLLASVPWLVNDQRWIPRVGKCLV